MSIDISSGIGSLADLASKLVDRFFPDKTQAQKDAFTLELTQLTQTAAAAAAQAQIDAAEASSPDRINHWRGGLGWVCVAAFAWTFLLQPMLSAGCAMFHVAVTWPALDTSQMFDLLAGMLGLTGMHVYQQVKSN